MMITLQMFEPKNIDIDTFVTTFTMVTFTMIIK